MRLCELQAMEVGAASAVALTTFSELEPQMRGMPAIPRAHFLYVRAIFELGCGNFKDALHYIEQAHPLIRMSHWHIGEALVLNGSAEIYCALGRYEDATRCVDLCDSIIEGVTAPLVEFNTRLARAEILRNTGSADEFRAELATAFAIGREQAYANGFHTSSQLLRRLIPYGIEFGIEDSYCRWVILKRRFRPPNSGFVRWPWPIKIRAMGPLRIYVDDAEISFTGKAQRKPLDILKLLIGRPQGVEVSQIMDELWPDLDGDSARNAFDIALYRLRKILKHKEAVPLSNGRVALSDGVVWLDIVALENFSHETSPAALRTAAHDVLDLYRGSLFGTEETTISSSRTRDRSRVKFVHIVSLLAKQLEHAELWDEMSALYLQASYREPFDKTLRQGMTRALAGHGHDRPSLPMLDSIDAGTFGSMSAISVRSSNVSP